MANSMKLDDWLTRLSPADTPIFKHTRDALLALSKRRDDVSTRELAGPILADPLATLRVIFSANNRGSRRMESDIATVEHALMMQGIGPFLDKVAGMGTVEATPTGKHPKSLDALYRLLRMAQHAAWQARDFAVLHSDIRSEEVQVAALLYYAPELLFWLQAPDIARTLARLRRKEETEKAEEAALGFRLKPLRLDMLEAWKIPVVTRDMLNPGDTPRSRQIILDSCLNIANRSRHGWWEENLASDYLALASIENTPLESIISTAHSNAVRVARAESWVPAPPPAAWLPMLPGPWPEEPEEEEEVHAATSPAPSKVPASPTAPRPAPGTPTAPARPKAAQPAAQPAASPANKTAPASSPAASGTATSAHDVCIMPDADAFKQALKGIESHLDGSYNINQMSAVILKGLHNGIGLSRIMFAMVTPDGKRIKTRFTLGIPADNPLRHFEFSLGEPGLFGQLMGKTQGVWLNEGNRERLWPMLGEHLQHVVGVGDFFAMSLHSNAKPLGLIYADRGHGACNLDNHAYTDFKMLCLQAARGLGKVKL